jgi:hypothetical protein
VASRGYCTPADVAAELGGATFTPEEEALCDARIAAVEAVLDQQLGRTWRYPTPILGEQSRLYGPHVYLLQRPVLSVERVELRDDVPSSVGVEITTDEGWRLVDGVAGLLVLGVWYRPGTWCSVDYTHVGPTAPVPPDVALFTAKAAAHFMGPVRTGGTSVLTELGGVLDSLAVGQGDLSLHFRASATTAGMAIPAELWSLVAGYRRVGFA